MLFECFCPHNFTFRLKIKQDIWSYQGGKLENWKIGNRSIYISSMLVVDFIIHRRLKGYFCNPLRGLIFLVRRMLYDLSLLMNPKKDLFIFGTFTASAS